MVSKSLTGLFSFLMIESPNCIVNVSTLSANSGCREPASDIRKKWPPDAGELGSSVESRRGWNCQN